MNQVKTSVIGQLHIQAEEFNNCMTSRLDALDAAKTCSMEEWTFAVSTSPASVRNGHVVHSSIVEYTEEAIGLFCRKIAACTLEYTTS